MVAVGVGLAVDLPASLMVGGIELIVYCLLVADVEPADGGGRRRS